MKLPITLLLIFICGCVNQPQGIQYEERKVRDHRDSVITEPDDREIELAWQDTLTVKLVEDLPGHIWHLRNPPARMKLLYRDEYRDLDNRGNKVTYTTFTFRILYPPGSITFDYYRPGDELFSGEVKRSYTVNVAKGEELWTTKKFLK